MRAPAAQFERVPLIAGRRRGTFEGMMFRLDKETEYYVESNGVRSEHYTLKVVDLPTVSAARRRVPLPRLHGPASAQEENGGDVAALRGTEVLLHIMPTMKTSGGQILFKDGGAAPLTVQADGTLDRQLQAPGPGFYRIELDRTARARRSRRRRNTRSTSRRSAADRVVQQAGARHRGDGGRGSLHRGEGRRRLRRQAAADGLLGERRAAEDDPAVRRREAADRGERRPHDLSRGAGPPAGRLRVRTSRRRPTTTRQGQTAIERHLLRRRSGRSSKDYKQAQSQARRRWRRRRRRRRSASSRASSAKSSPRRSTPFATRRRPKPTSTARTSSS